MRTDAGVHGSGLHPAVNALRGCGRMMTPEPPPEILHSYSDRNLVSYRACEDRLPICLHAPAQIDPRQHPILRAPQRAPRWHLATPVAAEADRSASRGSDPEHQLCVCRRRGSQPRPCSRARAMWDSARYVRCRDQRIRSDLARQRAPSSLWPPPFARQSAAEHSSGDASRQHE